MVRSKTFQPLRKEGEPIDQKLRHHFEDEDGEHNPIDGDEEASRDLHCRRPGLEPECYGVEQDHRGDESGKAWQLDQLPEPLDESRIAWEYGFLHLRNGFDDPPSRHYRQPHQEALAMQVSVHSFLRLAKLAEPLMTSGGCFWP